MLSGLSSHPAKGGSQEEPPLWRLVRGAAPLAYPLRLRSRNWPGVMPTCFRNERMKFCELL